MQNKIDSQDIKAYQEISQRVISQFIDTINLQAIIKAKECIMKAKACNKRLHITGIGKPGHLAGYIASLFSSTGTPAYFLDGTEAIHGSSGQVLEGDVVIAISNSGETSELKKTVTTLKNNGAIIIGVAGNLQSWLAANSAVFLFAGVETEGDKLNKPPRLSIVAEMIVLQILSVALQYEEDIDYDDYLKWHPGGALGKSIREMKQNEN